MEAPYAAPIAEFRAIPPLYSPPAGVFVNSNAQERMGDAQSAHLFGC